MALDPDDIGQVIALGGTFPTHHSDRVTKWPAVWQEPDSALIAEGETIEIPSKVSDVVVGPEPTVVLGDSLFRATEEEAAEAIAGYTVSNDVTSRGEWPGYCYEGEDFIDGFAYKMLPTFRPILSDVVDLDLDEVMDLEVSATIDGETVVSGSTSQIPFSIPEILVHVSEVVELEAGDVIPLGDPGNCSLPLDDAAETTCYVEGIGELTNPVENLG